MQRKTNCLLGQNRLNKKENKIISKNVLIISSSLRKGSNSDVLAFATPVYYYRSCGQLKTLLDRANPLFASDYKFRDVYLLASAAEDASETVKGTETAIRGWADCFEKTNFKKTTFAGDVNDAGDIKGHSALKESYKTGMSV